MKLKEFDILLDIKRNRKIEEFEVVQGDYGSNVLSISIVEDLEPYNLSGLNAEIAFAKPDGTTVIQDDTEIQENKIICTLKTNTITAPGRVNAEVRILEGEKLLTTARFNFFVRRAIVNDETIKSTNEFPVLNEKIDEVNDLIEYVQGMEAIKGDDGKSAYEVWLEAGNTGTVEDYLASLKGEPGPEGEQGKIGPVGPDGKSIEYTWNGTELGIRLEGQTEYQYVDLKGPRGEKGNKGDPGTSLKILGNYDTLQELQTAHPDGSSLDGGFMVGIDYFYWGLDGWTNAGPLQGPKGEQGEIGPQGLPGLDGKSLEFVWNGTQLGVRIEGHAEYQYVNLKGEKGDKGDTGIGLNFLWQETSLGVKLETDAEYVFVDLRGPQGPAGTIEGLTSQHVTDALGYTPADDLALDDLTETVKGNADNLSNFKTDYEYQIPTIINSQIQISKQSDTNRLYFKLDSNLEGSITISLDGGITELPLQDIDGNQVTYLDKGFVEVVAEANFFTLRPKGSGGINDTLPPQIENFNATASDGKIDLTWTIQDKTYLDGYVFTYKANAIPSNVNDGIKILADKLSTSLVIDGLTNDVLYYIRAFPYNNKKQYQTEYRVVQSIPKAGIPISDLPIGAKVKFGEYQVETEPKEPIIWLIADKNHTGYPANSVTLLTEKIIDLRGFDAKEPNNSNSDRQKNGNNRYKDSNIRQWLNKEGYPWYANQHGADAPPNDAGMNQPTGYDDEPGFLSSFSENEVAAILDTTLTVAKNTVTDGGGSEIVQDLFFLPSTTELGLANENSIAEGSLLPLFSDDASRKAYLTQQCFDNAKSASKPATINDAWYYWLRTPDSSRSFIVRYVFASGTLLSGYACYGDLGVRPLCNLKSEILVSDVVDSDGCYTVLV